MTNCVKLVNCICCGSSNLMKYLDLGKHPIPNYYPKASERYNLEKFPLGLNLCKKCFHSQLTHIIDPNLLFLDYPYVSGTSNTLTDYFKKFAKKVCKGKSSLNVLDIASNDGTLLDIFRQQENANILGIDPAKNLAIEANLRQIPTICEYFNLKLAQKINKKFDIIVAQNVLAHVSNPYDFLLGCKELLNKNGKLYIQVSQAEMIKYHQFDTCYFEHISFFNIKSFQALLSRINGLYLSQIKKVPVHGISYLFIIETQEKKYSNKLELDEKDYGIYNMTTYNNFQNYSNKIINNFLKTAQKRTNTKLIGYGAAAKGNTILNYIKNLGIKYIIDENPKKHFRYTPGSNIPIYPLTVLETEKENLTIILFAWNFYDEIKQRIKTLRPNNNDILITYFPILKEKNIQ